MQRGYPVRADADPTIRRNINRAAGPKEVPEMLRQGKVPVRQDAATGRTYPVMQRGNTDGHRARSHIPVQNSTVQNSTVQKDTEQTIEVENTVDRPIPAQESVPQRPAHPDTTQHDLPLPRPDDMPFHDPLSDTQTFTRLPTTETPPAATSQKSSSLARLTKMPQLGVCIACLVLVVGLAIGIPVALSHRTTTQPDFSMSTDYVPTESDTEPDVADTAGVGRDEATETETEPAVKFAVTLNFFDREPITVSTTATTVEALLAGISYTILDTDSFSLPLDTKLTEDTTITVDTVTYDTATETVVLPYESKVTEVQTIPKGQKEITQAGQNGSKTITYTVKFVNGEEAERTVASENVTVSPVDELGQIGVGGTLVGNDGVTYSYSYYRVVSATYYDIPGATYLGYDADETVVATNFNFIPAGTKIYVKNDRYDFGVRTAADTGSSIDDWEVDIWLSNSNPQKAALAKEGYIHDMIIYYID